ncbi:MAG: carboxypeptidase-like regulatory domain-containing protein, partial [Sphingobacterium sp.]
LPFPILNIHRANQTYAYQLQSYNLMNFMEFISDHHASWNMQYYMNGFLFNKIPLLKKLKLREVFSFKGAYGGLRDENNPTLNNSLFAWQTNAENQQSSFTFANKPYMEISAGVANIFKILRVDLVKRLSYLDHPDAPQYGIRARIKFDF